jgi:peptidoglycan/LPS O-acetylase OafA/YrhL
MKSGTARVEEIDLLRFLAALSVVFFHYAFMGYASGNIPMRYPTIESVAQYGYLGVHLFFMISGFVILMSASSGNINKFIVSRIVRLYPAFWTCCTLTFLVILLFGAPKYSTSFSQYLINLPMLNGFLGVPSLDGAYWSLFVEIKFYVLVAFVLLLGKIHHAQRFLILWLLASVTVELFPVWKFRSIFLVDFSAYFIAGATYFLIRSQGFTLTRATVISLCWWLALYEAVFHELPIINEHYKSAISGSIVVAIITLFFSLLLLVSLTPRPKGAITINRLALLGSLTYPLYLIHQKIGYIVFNALYLKLNTHLLFWGMTTLSLCAAFLVHFFIEKKYAPILKKLLAPLPLAK